MEITSLGRTGLKVSRLCLGTMNRREQVVLATKLYRPMGPGLNDGGLSARHIWHIARAQEAARACSSFGMVSEQSLYNLMNRTVEHEVLPACQYYGIGVIPWSPLNRGVLGGILASQPAGRRSTSNSTAPRSGVWMRSGEQPCALT